MVFNRLFGTNRNFDADSKTNAKEDALSIQETIDFIFIRAAWDEYTLLKRRDPAYDPEFVMRNPAWTALSKVIDYNGDFKKFTRDEKPLLMAIKMGYVLYADVLHVLIDHHDDARAGHELFDKYPDLHSVMPEQYDNDTHVIEVVIEVVKDYQWQLEHFAMKHESALDNAIAKLG